MKTILCYGDSNTWGYVPGSVVMETMYMKRFPPHQRWTGRLQKLLGSDFSVVEEGLNGRTTNVDYVQYQYAGRNGKTFLPVCLYSHAPIDVVVLMLSTNDLKVELDRTSAEIVAGIGELIEIIRTSIYGADMQQAPQVLLVNPPTVTDEEAFFGQFKGAMKKSQALAVPLADLAHKTQCFFLDAAQHIEFSEIDGIHLDAAGHETLARLVKEKIEQIDM